MHSSNSSAPSSSSSVDPSSFVGQAPPRESAREVRQERACEGFRRTGRRDGRIKFLSALAHALCDMTSVDLIDIGLSARLRGRPIDPVALPDHVSLLVRVLVDRGRPVDIEFLGFISAVRCVSALLREGGVEEHRRYMLVDSDMLKVAARPQL